MENIKYSTALSHLALAGTGVYCFLRCDPSPFVVGPYVIIISNSVLGVWRWGNPDYGDKVDSIYNLTTFLQSITALPFIVTRVWLKCCYENSLVLTHSGITILPLWMYLADRSYEEMLDLIIAVNGISLGFISFFHENYYGIAASISYLFNHFCLREGQFQFLDMPILDLYNYGLCFYCYFALRAI